MLVAGGGGIELNVVEAGDANGPSLLFLHGYCQSTYAWRRQFESDLARDFRLVAFDLRGHGLSGKPAQPEAYTEAALWAEDVAAVIVRLELSRPILIGWSYAGLVICDYLRVHGSSEISAINFVSAVTSKGGAKGRALVGPRYAELFPAIFSDDARVVGPIFERFTDLCVADPTTLDRESRALIVEAAAQTTAPAREAMQRGRTIDNDDVLRSLQLPVLCTHGSEDAVVLPASSEHIASVIPNAQLSIYPGVGHSPFAEDPVRFNRELRELAARIA